jgi:tetratricopeptide (TPR) repeat protein
MEEGGTTSETEIIGMINEAKKFYDLEEYKKSLNIYNNIVKIDERNVNALYSIGVIKANLNLKVDSIKSFEKVHQIMPNHPPTVANLSCLLENESPKEAAEFARIALITYPDNSDLIRISNIKVEESESTDSEEIVNDILLISEPVNPELKEENLEESDDEVFNLLVSKEVTTEDRARELNDAGDYIGAVKLWKEILEVKSESYEAWIGLSESLKMAGHNEKSIQCKNRADILKNDQSKIKEHNADDENYVDQKKAKLINKKYNNESGYEENVNISIEWYNKGINFLSEDRSSDALSCFEKAIGGCPKEEKELRVRSQNGRGDALYQMSKYSESILAYHAAISLEPSLLTGRTLYNMGQSYAFLELYDDALKCFEQSLNRGLEKNGIETCKIQINRCRILLREQNKRK